MKHESLPRFIDWTYVPEKFEGWFLFGKEEDVFPVKIYVCQGQIRHKLDGPAMIYLKSEECGYFINDSEYSEEEYCNHPEVIKFNILKKIETIVNHSF